MQVNVRNNKFTYLRAIACVAIVLLHTLFTAVGLYGYTVENPADLLSYRIVIDNLMWAVPCFLMVTGALLLNRNKEISYDKLFKKYILRILLAIVVFGAVFAIIDTFYGQEPASLSVFLNQMKEIWTGKTWSHMWYLYCLIGLYLLLPFYKKIVNGSSKKEIMYLMVLYVIFLSVIPLIGGWDIHTGFYIHVSTVYPLYFFAGFYLNEYRDYSKKLSVIILILITLNLAILSCISWYGTRDILGGFFEYNSLLVIIQSCSAFMIFMTMKDKESGFMGKLLTAIDKNGFGIYLVHMILVRYIFKQMQINPFEMGGWLCIMAIIAVVMILSWIIVAVLKKVPGLKIIF